MKIKIAAALAAGALLVSACGGDGGRPSADDIADAFMAEVGEEEFTQENADCIGEALHGDDTISDEALQAIVDGDESFEGGDAETEALMGHTMECLMGDMEMPELPELPGEGDEGDEGTED